MPLPDKNNKEEDIKSDVKRPMKGANAVNSVLDLYYGTAEKTGTRSALVSDSFFSPFNPDDLWQRTGDYSIYEDMEKDDQVSVCAQLKLDLVVGNGWDIIPTDDSGDDVAKYIQMALEEDPDVPFDDQIEEFLRTGYNKGFAIGEKVFNLRKDNFLTLNKIKTTHPNSWRLHTDEKGKVIKYQQIGSLSDDININPKSIIHYVNSRQYQNPYGTSDLRKAYNPWIVKRHIIKFYSIFLEKYASPIPIGTYELGSVNQSQIDDFFNILKSFQQKTAMVVPDKFKTEFLQSMQKGEAYSAGINLFNMFIGRALLLPDLLGFTGSESQSGGSQALGREQLNIFFMSIGRKRKTLERLINRHIVQPMCVWNYGMQENFPQFKLREISDEDTDSFATRFLEAAKANIYKPSDAEINHFRSLIKFPEGDVEREEKVDPFADPMNPLNPETNNPMAPGNMKGKKGDPKLEDDKNKPNPKDNPFQKGKQFAYKNPEGDFYKRVDFTAIKAQLDSGQATLVAESLPLFNEIFEDLYDQIQKKKILEGNGKPERIESIKLKKLKPYQLLLKKHFRQHWNDSRIMAKSELIKQTFAIQDDRVNEYRKKCFVNELSNDDFLNFLEQETFQYVGDWEYQITKQARIEMMNAIRDGRPISSVIDMMDSKTKAMAKTSLERYARTKFTEIMNRARKQEWDESGVVNGFQYSAILDDRTTPICAGLHGKKFKAGSEPTPPMHFNCRSLLIPITIFEDFSPDKRVGNKDINTFIDDNLGDGFSRS